MSADDTWVVTRLFQNDTLWGVFHVMGDDRPGDYYTQDNAVWVFSNPVDAIIQGHICNRDSYAEYGCYVHSLVIHDARDYHTMNTNNIVKHPNDPR